MKRLSLYLFLILFTLQTPSQANDIRDFQIEGMSIGDSLLDYFSEEKIKKSKRKNAYRWKKDRKFTSIEIQFHPSFKIYDAIQATYKTNDKKFQIYMLSGFLDFPNNIKDCYKKKNEIVKELSEIFKNISKKVDRGTGKHTSDDSGKSITTAVEFHFNSSDHARISCTDWSKEMGWIDNLRVGLATSAFLDWINK